MRAAPTFDRDGAGGRLRIELLEHLDTPRASFRGELGRVTRSLNSVTQHPSAFLGQRVSCAGISAAMALACLSPSCSFESCGGGETDEVQEGVVSVKAPSGKLGIMFEKIDRAQLGHVVAYVRDDSVLTGQIARGDAICKVDKTVTEKMDHDALRTFLVSCQGSERKLFIRKKAFRREQERWILNDMVVIA